VLTNVQVLAGGTSVARFDDVVVWFETGPDGGAVMLTQLLEVVQGVASGSVPSRQLGARLAAVLNTGDAAAVPAMVAATPEGDGLRVVVHGWGAVVADGIHLPNGWVDQLITDRRTFFLGRNTVTPVAPVEGSSFDLEDGIVPGDGVSFALAPAPLAPGGLASPSAPPVPVAAAPPVPAAVGGSQAVEPPAYEPPASDPPSVTAGSIGFGSPATRAAPAPAAHSPGRLLLDDGSSATLERTCVLGSAPHGSPAVQTGVALPLTVQGVGVAPLHAEVRVEPGGVAVRDLGSATTYVLPPGTSSWTPLAAGQISPLAPGTRVALGQRTFSYERP
jgi:hypothetical protein